jgi:predicted RND superfamily exporter protein
MDTSQIFPKFGNFLFKNRKAVLAVILGITVFFATQIPAVRMLSDFADLLPQEHPYI